MKHIHIPTLVSHAVVVAIGLWLTPCGFGQQAPPQPAGIASGYHGDSGIEKDPSILFAEDLEADAIPVVGYGKPGGFYDTQGMPKEMYITDKEAAVGRHSLELLHPASVISPQWFHRSFPAQDTVYVRFYRKFATDYVWPVLGQHDTYLFAGKYNSPAATDMSVYLDVSGIHQKWSAKDALADTVLNQQPVLVLKSSYQGPGLDFGIGKPITSHVGWDNYYILPYNRRPAPVLEGGRWYCFEYMAKMNTVPDKKDGEIRLWIDGNLTTEMTGLLLRDSEHQGIKWDHWMLGPRYGGPAYKEGPPHEQKSWIDGIVAATRYIGPATP